MSEGKLHGYGEKTSKTYLDAGTVRFLFSSFILNLIPDTDSGYTIFFTEKGQWVNGEMHGYGSSDLKINDLHILYEGLFLQSKQNGLGTFKIKSTNYSVISEVSFQNGTPSGNWTTFDYNGNFFYQHVPRNSSILNFIPKNTEIKFVQVFSGDKPTNWEAYFSTNRSEDVVSIKVFPQNQTIITWGNGNRYEGDVNMNGKASFFWKDGSWYTGDFVNGIKQGYGTMSYADGDVWNRKSYVGQWSRDKESGFGTVVLKSAEQYAGKWTAGSFEGKDSTGKVLKIGYGNSGPS
jgi:hypothetical protein